MTQKIVSLVVSVGVIVLGIALSLRANSMFYILIIAGALYGIYDIYLIATHKRKTRERQETQKKLTEQHAFGDAPPPEVTRQTSAPDAGEAGAATIVVNWFREKMGMGEMAVTVNGVAAGAVKKGNLRVTYHTNVPFNVVTMGVYKAEIELSPGDTVEYFVAGNGIRHNRTMITKGAT